MKRSPERQSCSVYILTNREVSGNRDWRTGICVELLSPADMGSVEVAQHKGREKDGVGKVKR